MTPTRVLPVGRGGERTQQGREGLQTRARMRACVWWSLLGEFLDNEGEDGEEDDEDRAIDQEGRASDCADRVWQAVQVRRAMLDSHLVRGELQLRLRELAAPRARVGGVRVRDAEVDRVRGRRGRGASSSTRGGEDGRCGCAFRGLVRGWFGLEEARVGRRWGRGEDVGCGGVEAAGVALELSGAVVRIGSVELHRKGGKGISRPGRTPLRVDGVPVAERRGSRPLPWAEWAACV